MLMMIRSECLMFVVCELYGIEERNVKGIDEAIQMSPQAHGA